jgi:hypothetical protein
MALEFIAPDKSRHRLLDDESANSEYQHSTVKDVSPIKPAERRDYGPPAPDKHGPVVDATVLPPTSGVPLMGRKKGFDCS